MACDIKRWLTSEKPVKSAAILIFVIAISVILYTIIVFVPPIINSIEIQNGTFNYTSPETELQTAISAGNLVSSIVVAGTTVIYVVLTAFILDATNKNTQQSALSIEQTAKAQKIAYLKSRLELFYLPMQSALRRFDINRMMWGIQDPKITVPQKPFKYYEINNMWWGFRYDYDKVIPFTYLASDDVKKILVDFTNIFELNRLFSQKYTADVRMDDKTYNDINSLLVEGCGDKFEDNEDNIYTYHQKLVGAIHDDVNSISIELKKLVNL